MSGRCLGTALAACLTLAPGSCYAQTQDSIQNRSDARSDSMVAFTPKAEPGSAPSAPASVSLPLQKKYEGSLLHRLSKFYLADWTGSPQPADPAPRRALDAPLDSPPFPASDWGYGGSVTIGVPDTNVYPVMSALKNEEARPKVYGWLNAGVNASTSSENNLPLSYVAFPNRVALHQAVIVVERQPETVQLKHFDWGFHLMGLYGTDYRFTVAKGIWSKQLLEQNHEYGFDSPWASLGLYFPVRQGLIVRIGRFLAVPGIESQLTPNNFNLTHSLAFSAAPSTDTGAIATLKLTKQWMVQAGISAGHDVAPWSADRKASAIGCVNYSTARNYDNFYLCANGINDGRYAYNNVQQYDATWNHRFNAKWNMATEGWIMYERDVPNIAGNVAKPVALEAGANGAFCAPGQARCFAPEYAMVSYLNRAVNSKLFAGFRADVLNDKKGQRTGTPGKFTENTFYATKYIGSTVMLRPELRFDHSWDRRGYDNGRASNQLFFGVDLIYKF